MEEIYAYCVLFGGLVWINGEFYTKINSMRSSKRDVMIIFVIYEH
jgi:hypothetical protein